MVAHAAHDEHEQRDADEHQRHGAVEAAGLGVRPRVERADDLAALVGVRARVLERAAVADVRLGAVAQQPPLVVDLVRPQVLALRAAPVIVLGVVLEAGGAVAQRAAVGVHRQPLEHAGGDQQEDRVARGEDRFGRHDVVFAAAASSPIVATPAGSWISVNRMSSGSSSVVRLTVWRIPT